MTSLKDRVALVTGGGQGVGRGIALALAAKGARVAVCGRTRGPLEAVKAEIEARGGTAFAVTCDVSLKADLERLVPEVVAAFGAPNILVNNAAFVPHGALLEIDDDTIQAAWAAGPLATLNLMRLCHPYLKGGGAIINVSSAASIAPAVHDRGIYAAVKAALNAISRAAANEWAADGIRVNTIMPVARTDAFERWETNEPQMAAAAIRNIPLGRVGDCEADIGRAVAFLAGPDADYVTGALMPLDGGSSYIR
jgi:meso-butanediol dehydrogenase/(S,S)-butanediol dehydrogenase/diacetyl reductase